MDSDNKAVPIQKLLQMLQAAQEWCYKFQISGGEYTVVTMAKYGRGSETWTAMNSK